MRYRAVRPGAPRDHRHTPSATEGSPIPRRSTTSRSATDPEP